MENTGRVVKVWGKAAYVNIRRTSACGGDCSKCMGCASGGVTVKLENTINAKQGDRVRVVSMKNNLTASVLYIYIIPLLLFIASYLLISSIISPVEISVDNELAALGGALAIMTLSYAVIKLWIKKLSESGEFELRMDRY